MEKHEIALWTDEAFRRDDFNMKIMLIGSSGSGKSTFSREFGEIEC